MLLRPCCGGTELKEGETCCDDESIAMKGEVCCIPSDGGDSTAVSEYSCCGGQISAANEICCGEKLGLMNSNPKGDPWLSCCGNKEVGEFYDPDWKGIGISYGVSAPNSLVSKIESVVNYIPGINVGLDEVSASYKSDKKDCCESPGIVFKNGVRYREGT